MTNQQFNAARDRSYTVQRTLPIGSAATLTADTYYAGRTIPAGTGVRVLDYTNAGFRGIEATVVIDGERFSGISAGLLEAR